MKIHIIKKGESLEQLCKKYEVDVDKVLEINASLSRGIELKPGQKLKIPSKTKQIKFERPNQKEFKTHQVNKKAAKESVPTGKHKDLFDEFNVPATEVGHFYDVPPVPELNEIETKSFEKNKQFQFEQNKNAFHPQTPYDAVNHQQFQYQQQQFQNQMPHEQVSNPWWNSYAQTTNLEQPHVINPYMSFVNTHHFIPANEYSMNNPNYQIPMEQQAVNKAASPRTNQTEKSTSNPKKDSSDKKLKESKVKTKKSSASEKPTKKDAAQAKVRKSTKRKSIKNNQHTSKSKNNSPWINL
ncbi:LysM peptidoglycan-binding domain-containing protein [Chengkuizengella sediminis]|uniref:LysM peptidoglycan-binding domain-containing protein n=1 Tax=Chengkuizengella sediminis TaxID=1885917 RepID=UPI001389E22E|nr:LysM peptidoglycan-binding domain-containing protein [Chengkuizengella sediminis]